MSINLNTLNDFDLYALFTHAETNNKFDSFYCRLRDELFEKCGRVGEKKAHYERIAYLDSLELFKAMSRAEQIALLWEIHGDFLEKKGYAYIRDLNTLKTVELLQIFEAAEEYNVYDSLYLRCRAELCEKNGVENDGSHYHNEAYVESWRRFRAMSRAEKNEFLRDVHSTWLANHDFE